jgi:cbb3-type cytochrome oxidase maturation protein
MYFPYFIAYISIGLVISIVVFIWAIKNGQFKDQQRARFLPLENDSDRSAAKAKASWIRRYEIYALFFLALGGLGASATVLIYALFYAP